MASPQAILAASRAARLAKSMPGAARPTPAPQGSLDGPWIGQLPDYSAQPGNPYSYGLGPFLPRPSEDFTAGAFAPFSPILPVPADMPPPGAQRPQPRRREYRVGENLPTGTPGSEGYNLASFSTLYSLSNVYSILRRCLQIRKQEIRALDWDIVLTKDAAKAYRGDKKAMRDFGERQAAVKKWFRRPDPNYFTFSSWLDAMLDQVFVYDALSIYMCPVKGRGMGKGLLGSDLDSLWVVDGSTIRPLTGMHGEYPAPPAPSAQQYLYGVPRSDFTQMVDGRDLQEQGITEADLAAELRSDQLLYLPFTQRAGTPYGFGLVEQCLIPIMTGLNKQAYQLSFFDESSVPKAYISPGDVNMTPNQIRELQLALNAVAGDLGNFFKVTVLPPGSKVIPQKEMQIVDQADEWIANEVAMTCGIRPTEIGVIPQVSTVASPFAAREMAQAQRSMHDRIDTKPTLKFITEIFDTIIQIVCKQDDMRFLFSGMEEQADKSAAVDAGIKQIQSGVTSIDEFRDEIGLTPWGYPETQGPIVFTPMGPIPLFEGVQNALAQQQERQQPSSGAHAASEGATGKKPAKAITQGANASGRPGSVTERQASRGGALAPQHATGTGAPGTATAGRTGKAASGADMEAFQDRGEPLREAAGIDGTAGDAQDVPHRFADDGHRACGMCGLAFGAEVHKAAGASDRAAMAELQALTRHLRKGRAITTWEARHLSPRVMSQISEDLAKGLTPEQILMITGPVLLKAQANPGPKAPRAQPLSQSQQQALAQQYAAQIQTAFTAAIAAAGLLIAQWAAGTLAVTAAVLAGMIVAEIRKRLTRVLAWLWKAAWKDGAGDEAKALKEALAAFLATHGANWASLIAGTGEAALLQAIKDALASGDPEAVAERLRTILNVDARSETIAITEVMRAWNAAALAAMKLAGVAFAQWVTTGPDPCPTCIANRKASPLPVGALYPGGLPAPLQHVRCVIGSTRVSAPLTVMAGDITHRSASGVVPAAAGLSPTATVAVAGRDFGRGNIRAVTDREYVGDVIVIRTALGHELTVTPNHPVATRGGWVQAAELTVGSYVLSSTAPEWVVDAVHPDEDDVPPRIEDVAKSLPVSLDAVPLTAEDFHGDGEGSEVCVIRSDRLLVDGDDSVLTQHVCEHDLGGRDGAMLGTLPFNAERSGDEKLGRLGLATDSRVGGIGHPGALLGSHPGNPDLHRRAATPGFDAGFEEPVADGRTADSEGFCERLLALTPGIALDEIVQVKRDVVATHVYNLDTVDGWYIGNGIVTHNCRCILLPAEPPKTPPVTAAKVLRRQVDTNGQEFWGDAPPLAANAAGGGATGPYPHRADGAPQEDIPGGVPGATAGGEPPRRDFSSVQPHVLSLPSSDDGEWGEAAGTGSVPQKDFPAPYMDSYWPGGGHGSQQAPTSSPGGANGRPPNPVGKAADAAKKFLKGAPQVKASVVYKQMLENFPAEHLGWVKDIKWVGPVEIPVSLLDFANSKEWAAHHQQGKVDSFARKIKAGKKVNPIIGIVKPGHNHVRIPDGRHRASACKKLGRPVPAYVGFVDTSGAHPSDKVYLWQKHSGSSPANKSGVPGEKGSLPGSPSQPGTPAESEASSPYVAGLMVRAGDTGRVLMLQRALDDDQDHAAGKLEPPGGHAEDGETLIGAALREFGEEMGHPAPPGSVAGSWTSSDGIYRGFVVDVPSEDVIDLENGRDQIENPDGDSFEIAIWVDPALFAGNPLIRPEMTRDHSQVMDALGGAFKSARTPIVSTVHSPLGHEGLWHTPDRHVSTVQELPAYFQNTAKALMRDGMGEQQAIATAVNAVKEWAEGHAFGGKVKVTPEVQAAARAAIAEWDRLKESHH